MTPTAAVGIILLACAGWLAWLHRRRHSHPLPWISVFLGVPGLMLLLRECGVPLAVSPSVEWGVVAVMAAGLAGLVRATWHAQEVDVELSEIERLAERREARARVYALVPYVIAALVADGDA